MSGYSQIVTRSSARRLKEHVSFSPPMGIGESILEHPVPYRAVITHEGLRLIPNEQVLPNEGFLRDFYCPKTLMIEIWDLQREIERLRRENTKLKKRVERLEGNTSL